MNDAIWKYNSPSGDLKMEIFDKGEGILVNYPVGTISLVDAVALFGFLTDYRKKYNGDLYMAIENSFIKTVSTQARNFVVNQFRENTPLSKAASFGSNVILRNFMNIFSGLMSRTGIHHHSFKTEQEAIDWLKR